MVYLWIIPFLLYDIIRVDGVRFEEKSLYRAYKYTILQKKGEDIPRATYKIYPTQLVHDYVALYFVIILCNRSGWMWQKFFPLMGSSWRKWVKSVNQNPQ